MSTETDTKVVAELREQFGKGFARRLRAAGKIPAVIYGHGATPVHVALPGHQVSLLIRRPNVVLELDVDGTQQLTLVKDVQKDPVHQIIEHIDLLVVKKGEKVQVEVPVHVEGESAPGTITSLEVATVLLEVEATHIPDSVVVSVEGREAGEHVFAKDLTLAKGSTLINDGDLLLIQIAVPAAAEAAEDAAEESAAAAPAAGESAE